MPQSQTRYLTTVIIAGRQIPGSWGLTGGRVVSEAMMDRAPGARYPTAAGGDATIEAITLTSRVDIAALNDTERTWLTAHVGVDDAATVNRRPLDRNSNPYGKGRTWTATLTSGPEEDSDPNADGDPAVVELIVQPSRVV